MAERDEGFDPARLDDDFEQLAQSVEDAQLVDALLKHYSFTRARSARALGHAWERIQQGQQPSECRAFQPGPTPLGVPIQAKIERISHMREIKSNSLKPKRLGRILNVLAAAVLFTVIVGSLALVYSHFNSQTSTGSGNVNAQTIQTTQIAHTPVATATAQITPASTPTPGAQKGATPIAGGSPQLWPVGQSTYWANQRYHQLTGYWVTWKGNADQWVTGARAAGWQVSQTPHVPSIIVLMPGVQSAGYYGHVGVVESINANGRVHTSNMNWSPNESNNFGKVTYVDFTVGSGVYFIWHA